MNALSSRTKSSQLLASATSVPKHVSYLYNLCSLTCFTSLQPLFLYVFHIFTTSIILCVSYLYNLSSLPVTSDGCRPLLIPHPLGLSRSRCLSRRAPLSRPPPSSLQPSLVTSSLLLPVLCLAADRSAISDGRGSSRRFCVCSWQRAVRVSSRAQPLDLSGQRLHRHRYRGSLEDDPVGGIRAGAVLEEA